MRRRALLLSVLAAGLALAAPASASVYGDGIRTTPGIAGYWSLDEATAPIADAVNSRTATPSFGYALGRPPGIDAGGTSMTLSGTAAASFGGNYNLSADRTIEAWIAPSTTSGDRYIVSKGTTTAGYHLYLASGGVPTFQVNGSRATAPALAAGGWHHLVATLTGRAMALYVDGRPAGNGTVSNTPATSSQTFWLGRLSRSSSGYFQGGLDEIAVYSRALDAATVAAHFAAGADVTPPQILFTAQPAPTSAAPDGTFAFTGSKGGVTFTCSLDDGAASACAGTYSYDLLRDGTHTLLVTATDRWGTTSATTVSWQIALPAGELAPPNTLLDTSPPAVTNARTAQLAFTGSKTPLTWTCRLDGGAWSPCLGSVSYSNLAEGVHTAEVRATDRWGTVEEVPAAATWRVDLTAPDTFGLVALPTTTAASAAAVGSEDGARFQCRSASGAWTDCAAAFALPGVTTATTMPVRAVDTAGNADGSPANLPVTPSPADDPDAITTSFAVVGARSTSGLQCTLDDRPAAACPSPLTFSGLSFGTHRLKVVDPSLGGVEFPTITWTIATPAAAELTAPVTALTKTPAAITNATTAAFAFASSKAKSRFACRLDGGAWTLCLAGTVTYANLKEGEHTVEVRATDRYGVQGEASAFHWTIDITPPRTFLLVQQPTAARAGQAVAGSEPGATFECRSANGNWASCPSTFSLPDLGSSYGLYVRATDVAGNVQSGEASVVVTPPPSRSLSFLGEPATFAVGWWRQATELRCSLDGAAPAACPAPLAYAGLGYGRHSLTISDPNTSGIAFPAIAFDNPLPKPMVAGSQFPAVLQLGSKARQASLSVTRLPRLLFQSNGPGRARITLTRGKRTIRRWSAKVVQGSNVVTLPRPAWRLLRPGRYQLKVVVTNASGASAPLNLRFDAVRTTRR